MAHKKAQWSTSNGRDSNAKRLGVKLFGWQKAISGNIIVRQKWNKYYPSTGVSQWKDFTLFAVADGTVTFFEKKKTKYDGRKYVETYVSIA
jgi:large subunit ribosomal protein L27